MKQGFKFEVVKAGPVTWSRLARVGQYKYRVEEFAEFRIPIRGVETETAYLQLDQEGWLRIKRGYVWDGPSGPTWDTLNFMRGSLIHDALYQLMRMELLPADYRQMADEVLYEVCRGDGMSRFRAWYVLRGVRRGAGFAAKPGTQRRLRTSLTS